MNNFKSTSFTSLTIKIPGKIMIAPNHPADKLVNNSDKTVIFLLDITDTILMVN